MPRKKKDAPAGPAQPAIEYEDLEGLATEFDQRNEDALRALFEIGRILSDGYRTQIDPEGGGVPRFLRWAHHRLGLAPQTAKTLVRAWLLYGIHRIAENSTPPSYAAILAMSVPGLPEDATDAFRASLGPGGVLGEPEARKMAQRARNRVDLAFEGISEPWLAMKFEEKTKFLAELKFRVLAENEALAKHLTIDGEDIGTHYRKMYEDRMQWREWRKRIKESASGLPAAFGDPDENRPFIKPGGDLAPRAKEAAPPGESRP